MNRLFAALTSAAMAATVAACAAGGATVYGGIQAINATAHTLSLYTGDTFQIDPNMDLSKWKVGDDVQVSYTIDAATKKKTATSISSYP
jgi:hypothetical protein